MSPSSGGASQKTASQSESARSKPKGEAVTVSRETVVRRLLDTRRTSMVIYAARAVVGGVPTLMISAAVGGALYLTQLPFFTMFTIVTLGTAAALVFGARLAARESLPEAASVLGFIRDRAFVWVDPFREERPRLLPMWLEAILWAPSQFLMGVVPLTRIRKTGAADAEAAADVARTMVEESQLDLAKGLPPGSAEAGGLRLLLLLRLARLVVEEGELQGRITGLGQTALFEGAVG